MAFILQLISSLYDSFASFSISSQFKASHLPKSLDPFFYSFLYNQGLIKESLVLMCKNTQEMIFYKDFFKSQNIPHYSIPFYDLLPYEEGGTISHGILEERINALYHISKKSRAIYLLPLKSLLFPTIKHKDFINQSLTYKVNDQINRKELISTLIEMGYKRLPFIQWKGSFSLRGEILDIYPIHYENPIRIYFFDSLIEKISHFSLDPQDIIEHKELKDLIITPIYDFIFDDSKKIVLLEQLKKEFGPEKLSTFAEIQNNQYNVHLAPFFYLKNNILDYFNEANHSFSLIINDRSYYLGEEKNISREVKELYFGAFNSHRIMVHPDQYLLEYEKIISQGTNIISIESLDSDNDTFNFSTLFGSCPLYKGRLEIFEAQIEKEYPLYKVILCAQNEMEQKQFDNLFEKYQSQLFPLLENGFIDKKNQIIYVTRTDLFGKKIKQLKHEKIFYDQAEAIDSFSDLERGDHIVHVQHGIGIYEGIEKISVLGAQKDYIKITYADEEVLYIPIEQIFLVHKYLGTPNPSLHNLGGKKWDQRKERVKKKLEEMAEDLAILYETRKQIKGFSFPTDTPFQKAFEASFPYEETDGQIQAINDVKKDMESVFVMDRLICGDVGYGKTEIALRAAFKTISSGKQVAFLAPTTLLVEQHFRGMLKRFENFTVNIKMLSRFVSPADQKNTLKELALGNIDIVVGTHSLLSEKIVFKDLGLLIVDEEQRFGVKHKERIKTIKNNVDVLTLSATPIPRTLYMGLSQIRDMSLITTPPINRLSIKTHVMPFNDGIIKLAIHRELERNGQVFIIHNRIKTIYTFLRFIQDLCPQARVVVGHAQMNEKDIENIFLGFMEHQYDILISTTIIENGIDIPNANTIIIDRPELLGLSELYQLRGRVGRSDKQAYSYLFYDAVQGLTSTMQKRLESLEELTELGSGFQIAMRDLEIRGAGNLLGKDQSGLFEDIGMELYTKMLKDVTDQVRGIVSKQNEPLIDIPFNGYIPEQYIPNENERFYIYKMLMRSSSFEDLDDLIEKINERYGQIPPAIHNLKLIVKMSILCKRMKVSELKYNSNKVFLALFLDKPLLNIQILTQYIANKTIVLKNPTSFSIQVDHEGELPLKEVIIILENLSKV